MSSTEAQVLMRGDVVLSDPVTGYDTTLNDVPLLATFPVGSRGGKVIFTSFHHDPQLSDDVRGIIEYLVFLLSRSGVGP